MDVLNFNSNYPILSLLIFLPLAGIYGCAKAKTKKDKAIISLSFGKDSLLSYGLAKESGLDYRIFFVEESEREKTAEGVWKKKIIKQFCQKERQKVYLVKDNIEKLFFHPKLSGKFKELENINGMLAFALELIPAAYYHRAKYLIFGNEATFNNFFINHDGFKAYPSFDQTSVYTRKENNDLDAEDKEVLATFNEDKQEEEMIQAEAEAQEEDPEEEKRDANQLLF